MGWESIAVVRFVLGPPPSRSNEDTKLKSAYNSLIIGLELWNGKPKSRKSWAGIFWCARI